MRAGGMMAQRRRQSNRGDAREEASAADAGGRADAEPTTITVHVPLAFHQRSGRKALVAPDGAGQGPLRAPQPPARSQRETTSAVRALARAFRWRRLLETGAMATVHEIAAADNINPSYVSRVLRLTLLAPKIVEALVGTEPEGVTLEPLMLPFATDWGEQAVGFWWCDHDSGNEA